VLDAARDLGRRSGPEPRERGEPPVGRRPLQLIDRVDAQGRIDLVDPARRQSGDTLHFHQPGGCFRPQSLEECRLAGLDELAEDPQCCRSDAAELGQRAGPQKGAEIIGVEIEDRACGVAIRRRPESVLPAQLEEVSDLVERMGSRSGIHRRHQNATRAPAVPAAIAPQAVPDYFSRTDQHPV